MSGGEPSSIKRLARCAARVPALSRGYEDRVEEKFDFAVYGLVLQHTLVSVGQFWLNRKSRIKIRKTSETYFHQFQKSGRNPHGFHRNRLFLSPLLSHGVPSYASRDKTDDFTSKFPRRTVNFG